LAPAKGETLRDAQRFLCDSYKELARRIRFYNITLKPSKCIIYTRSIRYVGHILTPEGVEKDPHSIAAIKQARIPERGDELAALYYGAQWCSRHIHNFARRFANLANALELMYADTGGERTSESIKSCKLKDYGIDKEHVETLLHALHNAARLAHRKPTWHLVLMSDASNTGWGGTLLQVPPGHLHDFQSRQDAQPLAFMGGRWNDVQKKYPTVE
jgi:hypothetical protein